MVGGVPYFVVVTMTNVMLFDSCLVEWTNGTLFVRCINCKYFLFLQTSIIKSSKQESITEQTTQIFHRVQNLLLIP